MKNKFKVTVNISESIILRENLSRALKIKLSHTKFSKDSFIQQSYEKKNIPIFN